MKKNKLFLLSGSARDASVFSNMQKNIITFLSIIVAFLHIFAVIYYFPDPILFRSFHASIFVAFAILCFSPNSNNKNKISIFDYAMIGFSIASLCYIILNLDRFILRIDYFDPVFPLDLFFGVIFILILLEAGRRVIGWPMLIVVIIFFLYSFFGHYISGSFSHRFLDFYRVIEIQYLTTIGMYGMVTGVSATFVFMFILFGSVLRYSGGSDFFFKIGSTIGGAARGGAAKTAVVSSALFGMISGSANANVATTGTITIPMMKSLGYRPEFAGAVESAASSAGTITPPVMGAVIFILAELTGVPYRQIMIIAILPSFLYYWSIFVGIDREAIVQKLKPIPNQEEKQNLKSFLLDGLPFIVPLAFLVYRIFRGIPPSVCAFESTLLIIFMAVLKSLITKNKDQISLKKYIIAIEEAVKDTIVVSVACVLAGTIVGNIWLTGIGVKFSSFLMSIAMGSKFLTIFLAAILTVIFGMGVPVSSAYLLAVSLAGPALIATGIPRLNAHFFVAYFASLGTITPPVCISSFMAAAIARANAMKVGWIAAGLAIGGFIVPFIFIYRPEILLGGEFTIISSLCTLIFVSIGVFILNTVLFGNFLFRKYRNIESIIVITSAIMIFWSYYVVNILGLLLFGIVALIQYQSREKRLLN